MDTTYAIRLMRAWAARRKAKGVAVTADDIWLRIRTKWPRAEEWQQEQVFQHTN